MGEFFDLTQDPRSGVAELVFNQPQRLNTMTPAFNLGDIERAIAAWKDQRPGEFAAAATPPA